MGRTPCCAKVGLNRGAWTALEDKILTDYIEVHGEGKWKQLPKNAGLKRCGKSCRLRWLNYLRPDIKRGNISEDEEDLIVRLHKLLGNRWSLIAGRIPGRTDNEIKNYWNTNLSKKLFASPSLSPVTANVSALPKNIVAKNTATTRNATNLMTSTTVGSNSSPRVFRTKATRCTKVVVKPQPPPPRLSTSSVIDSYNLIEGLIGDPLNNLENNTQLEDGSIAEFTNLLDDNFDDLQLGDFWLADFFNNDQFDNQSIINTDNEKDCNVLGTVNWTLNGHNYRGDTIQGSANLGSDGNPQPQQCPVFADMNVNNWDL